MNKERITRICQIFVTFCFLTFIFLGMYATITRAPQTYSYYENRNLSALPQYSPEGIIDGTYFSAIDTYIQEHSAGRDTLLQANTFLNLHVFGRAVVNDVVVGDQVLLPYKARATVNEAQVQQDAETMAQRLENHARQCESYGGKFYYVAVPCQYVLFEEEYPDFLYNCADYTALSSQALFSRLDQREVNYIDMLQVFRQQEDPFVYGSRVDNHYGIHGAYQTYLAIMERINADTGYDLDIMTDGDYTINEVPNPYLGSRSRKLMGLWPSDERLYTFNPTVDIPFTRYDWACDTAGTSQVYSMPQTGSENVLYSLYMGGDISHTIIDTGREELPSILIYGDSFTNAVECIIWNNFDQMDSLDFRHYKEMTLEQFIEENRPDIVICLRDYEALLNLTDNGQ